MKLALDLFFVCPFTGHVMCVICMVFDTLCYLTTVPFCTMHRVSASGAELLQLKNPASLKEYRTCCPLAWTEKWSLCSLINRKVICTVSLKVPVISGQLCCNTS